MVAKMSVNLKKKMTCNLESSSIGVGAPGTTLTQSKNKRQKQMVK